MTQPLTATSPDGDRAELSRAKTGIEGLDEILGGGFPENHLYLIDGEPGA